MISALSSTSKNGVKLLSAFFLKDLKLEFLLIFVQISKLYTDFFIKYNNFFLQIR